MHIFRRVAAAVADEKKGQPMAATSKSERKEVNALELQQVSCVAVCFSVLQCMLQCVCIRI